MVTCRRRRRRQIGRGVIVNLSPLIVYPLIDPFCHSFATRCTIALARLARNARAYRENH